MYYIRLPCIPSEYYKAHSYAEIVQGIRDSEQGYITRLKLTLRLINDGKFLSHFLTLPLPSMYPLCTLTLSHSSTDLSHPLCVPLTLSHSSTDLSHPLCVPLSPSVYPLSSLIIFLPSNRRYPK